MSNKLSADCLKFRMYKASAKKLVLDYRSPIADSRGGDRQSFLSPCQKYNQRSFSASSHLHSMPRLLPKYAQSSYPRGQFRKPLPPASRLTKTLLIRPSSNAFIGGAKAEDPLQLIDKQIRAEMRQLNKTILILRDQNQRLRRQKDEDLLLIARLSQILKQSEQRQLSQMTAVSIQSSHAGKHCKCFEFEQSLQQSTINSLKSKISHLEQVTHEYKEQLRQIILQNEHYKSEISKLNELIQKQRKRNDKLTKKILEEQENEVGKAHSSQQLDQYLEYIKRIRNREIDQIENILKYQ